MQVVKSYPNGLFNWIDLMTTDIEGAKAFYSGLFGWVAVDRPIDSGGFYTMFQLDGFNVAGGGQMSPEMVASGMPAAWTSYIKHEDVDTIAEKIQQAGGQLVMPPMEVMEEGRMLMATDPSGAVFGVWQPKNHIGAQLCNVPNTLVWNELQTRDIVRAQAFYAAVFDWTSKIDHQNNYILYYADGRMQAGSMAIDENWGDVPNNWSIYILVEDVEAMCARVEELGGKVIAPPTKAGDTGILSVVADPQGGMLSLMKFTIPVDPPPGY